MNGTEKKSYRNKYLQVHYSLTLFIIFSEVRYNAILYSPSLKIKIVVISSSLILQISLFFYVNNKLNHLKHFYLVIHAKTSVQLPYLTLTL